MATPPIELLRIPLRDVLCDGCDQLSEIRVLGLVERYGAIEEPINTIPVLVEADAQAEGKFRLIQGHEIYQALNRDGRLWIWAMRLTPAGKNAGCWSYETGLQQSKLNVSSLEPEALRSVLQHLRRTVPRLSKINVDVIVERCVSDQMRGYWSSLDSLQAPKSGLAKASLAELARYLEAIPQPLPPLVPICLNTASAEEIIRQLNRLSLEGKGASLRRLDVAAIGQSIAVHPDRPYWQDVKDAIRAIAGLTTSMQLLIAPAFLFVPQPAPTPNTVRFLLAKLAIKDLRAEATARGLVSKGFTKAELVDLLAVDS